MTALRHHARLLRWAAAGLACAALSGAEPARPALPVARPARAAAVDFDRELLPVLRANCLPCHNQTTTKADLVLETPADMRKGGESGPAIVPGKAAESLLFKLSAHIEKPRMPPQENKVNAVNLTPEELGLLALWIDQGAKASEKRAEVIEWQPLPDTLNPIFAVTVTSDGRYAACGRGNHVDVYRLPGGQPLGRLADAALAVSNAPASAHRDVVNALAFSPDGTWLASGGFREVKLWRRTFAVSRAEAASVSPADQARQLSPDGKAALWFTNGVALLSDAGATNFVAALVTDAAAAHSVAVAERALARLRSGRDARQSALDAARKELEAQRERLKKAVEAQGVAAKAVTAKEPAVAAARQARFDAELAVLRLDRSPAATTNWVEARKGAAEKSTAATKAAEQAEGELKPLLQKRSSAHNERELAATGIDKAAGVLLAAQRQRREADPAVAAAEAALRDRISAANRAVPRVVAGAFSPDSRLVATAHEDGTVRTWDAADGSPVECIPAGDGLRALAFAEAGTLLVTTAEAGALRVDLQPRWMLERTLVGPPDQPFADRITALAFRPDGLRLAVGGGEPTRGGDLSVWEPATGALLYALPALHSDTVLALAWSPDGALLASGGADRFARIVDTGTGRQARALEGHTGHVLGVAWSPDGAALASAGADLVVKLWDTRSGEQRKQAAGFGREVTAVSFLENGQQLVAASGDHELRVLNDKGERVLGLTGPGDFTHALAATLDGQRIVAGGQDGTLRVWRGGQAEPLLQLRGAVGAER